MSRVRRGKYGKHKKSKKQMIKEATTELRELYAGLYEDLMVTGVPEEKIEKELEDYHKYVSLTEEPTTGEDGRYRFITVRLQYPLDVIKKNSEWNTMNLSERRELLWGLGMNTRRHQFNIEKRNIALPDGKRYYGLVVYGQERLDKEWLSKRDNNGRRLASDDAIMYVDRVRDSGFREDIEAMERGEMWNSVVEKVKKGRG